MGIGYLLFIPAAHYMEYMAVMFALFVLATGVAFLQVALNPLIVKVGSEQTGSARMNLGGSGSNSLYGPSRGDYRYRGTYLFYPTAEN
ncbi:hypothetical protein [Shewanella benthica]|uniref:Glucose/galactose transporter family protein n=1 Tax=Shewanella benthica KT99 TaxID=314608 RepID=A9D2K9_9GAMM|nr:hypothetical protein [Shewanella benthica]EDQ01825.1 glucose/galactose transporter family protein [Shewanella benthica KT99]